MGSAATMKRIGALLFAAVIIGIAGWYLQSQPNTTVEKITIAEASQSVFGLLYIADTQGYFADEGLDYVFGDQWDNVGGKTHEFGNKVGAYQTFEAGRVCDVSSACHWTVNVAASTGHGKLYRDAYSVAPSAICFSNQGQGSHRLARNINQIANGQQYHFSPDWALFSQLRCF